MINEFSVRINGLYQTQEMLEASHRKMSMYMEELMLIRNRLTACSEMEGCIRRIEKAKTDIENQMAVIRQMIKALERTAEYYIEAENRAADYCEDMGYRRSVRQWGSSDLSGIHNSLEKLGMFGR